MRLHLPQGVAVDKMASLLAMIRCTVAAQELQRKNLRERKSSTVGPTADMPSTKGIKQICYTTIRSASKKYLHLAYQRFAALSVEHRHKLLS